MANYGYIAEALILRWSVQNFPLPEDHAQPKNSFQHVVHAYKNATHVMRHFESMHIQEDAPEQQISNNFFNTSGENFNSPVFAVDLTNAPAQADGWFVTRCLIPDAIIRETDSRCTNLEQPRFHYICKKLGISMEDLNISPHPYG